MYIQVFTLNRAPAFKRMLPLLHVDKRCCHMASIRARDRGSIRSATRSAAGRSVALQQHPRPTGCVAPGLLLPRMVSFCFCQRRAQCFGHCAPPRSLSRYVWARVYRAAAPSAWLERCTHHCCCAHNVKRHTTGRHTQAQIKVNWDKCTRCRSFAVDSSVQRVRCTKILEQ